MAWLAVHAGMACTLLIALLVNGHMWNIVASHVPGSNWEIVDNKWNSWSSTWSRMYFWALEGTAWLKAVLLAVLAAQCRKLEGLGQAMCLSGTMLNICVAWACRFS